MPTAYLLQAPSPNLEIAYCHYIRRGLERLGHATGTNNGSHERCLSHVLEVVLQEA